MTKLDTWPSTILPRFLASFLLLCAPTTVNALPQMTLAETVPGRAYTSHASIDVGPNNWLWASFTNPPFGGELAVMRPSGAVTSGIAFTYAPESIAAISDSVCVVLEATPITGGCGVRYHILTADGEQLYQADLPLASEPYHGCPRRIAAGADSALVVMTSNGYIEIYSLYADPSWSFYCGNNPTSDLLTAYDMATDPAGNIAVVFKLDISIDPPVSSYHLRIFSGDAAHGLISDIPLGAQPSSVGLDAAGVAYVGFSGDGASNRDVIRAYGPGSAFPELLQVVNAAHLGTLGSIAISAGPTVYVSQELATATEFLAWLSDADRDGIPDTWEEHGLRVATGGSNVPLVDLPTAVLSSTHKDIIVEIDAMTGRMPAQAVFEEATAILATLPSGSMLFPNPDGNDGISLHCIPSDSLIPRKTWKKRWWHREFYPLKTELFGSPGNLPSHRLARRLKAEVYRYCIFADSLFIESNRPAVDGELVAGLTTQRFGKDFAVGLGPARYGEKVSIYKALPHVPGGTPEQQLHTFIHELGHSLGLEHGGSDLIAYKPNYRSAMSYLFGWRSAWDLRNAPRGFQVVVRPSLNRTSLIELNGLGGDLGDSSIVWRVNTFGYNYPDTVSAFGPIDWNLDDDYFGSFPHGMTRLGRAGDAIAEIWTSPNDATLMRPDIMRADTSDQGGRGLGVNEPSEYDLDLSSFDECDCNRNSIADWRDIDELRAIDTNDDDIPDECERPRVAGLPGRLLACPGGDGGTLNFTVDYQNLCEYDRLREKGAFFAVLRRAPGATVRLWVEGGADVGSPALVENDTLWSDRLSEAHFGGIPVRLSGAGEVWFDIFAGSGKWFETSRVTVTSLDASATVLGAVDKFDRQVVMGSLGSNGGACDFDGSGLVDSADLAMLDAHIGHSFDDLGITSVSGTYQWGTFIPLLWRRGRGDSAMVTIKLGHLYQTGPDVTLGTNLVDDGSEIWPAYVTDAPASDYVLKLTRTAGVWDGSNAYAQESGIALPFEILVAGGGGCPIVSTLTPLGWVEENSILGRSLTLASGLDSYRLSWVPARDSVVKLRIVEGEEEVTTLDQVRLVAVDRSPGLRVYATGERVVLGVRVAAARVRTRFGEGITSLVSENGIGFRAMAGETLYVELGSRRGGGFAATTGGGDGFVIDDGGGKGGPTAQFAAKPTSATEIDAAVLSQTGIVVQQLVNGGSWQSVTHHYPRERQSEALMSGVTSSHVRLIVLDDHRINFLGQIEQSGDSLSAWKLPLKSASHSRSPGLSETAFDRGNLSTTIEPGDTLTLEFRNVGPRSGKARDYLLLSKGVYTASLPARLRPAATPSTYRLIQSAPNPVHAETAIRFEVPERAAVRVEMFDLQGRLVSVLTDREYEAGRHSLMWNRRDRQGIAVLSGVYLCRMRAGSYSAEKKLVVVD